MEWTSAAHRTHCRDHVDILVTVWAPVTEAEAPQGAHLKSISDAWSEAVARGGSSDRLMGWEVHDP